MKNACAIFPTPCCEAREKCQRCFDTGGQYDVTELSKMLSSGKERSYAFEAQEYPVVCSNVFRNYYLCSSKNCVLPTEHAFSSCDVHGRRNRVKRFRQLLIMEQIP